MRGREFLDVARSLVKKAGEAHWRTAAGRAYLALLLEGRDLLERWGFTSPPQDQAHKFVLLRFLKGSEQDLDDVGRMIDRLSNLRGRADYLLVAPAWFATNRIPSYAIANAEAAIQKLDQLDADPTRRAAAIADIRSRWP